MAELQQGAKRPNPSPSTLFSRQSLLAILGLVLSGIAWVGYVDLCYVPDHSLLYRIPDGVFWVGVMAVVLSVWALVDIWLGRRSVRSKPVAWGGFLLGSSVLILSSCMAIYTIKTSVSRMQRANSLKQIALAFHDYHDKHGRFPPAAIFGKDGELLLSWRVLLLPYLEQEELFQEFQLDEPWDSPHNLALLPRMPKIYSWPGPQPPGPFETFYQVIVGPGTGFEGVKGLKVPEDFPDGTDRTFLVVEATEAVPWTKPADLVYDPNGSLPRVGGEMPSRAAWYEVPRSDAFNAVFVDGAVWHCSWQHDCGMDLIALITRNGQEK